MALAALHAQAATDERMGKVRPVVVLNAVMEGSKLSPQMSSQTMRVENQIFGPEAERPMIIRSKGSVLAGNTWNQYSLTFIPEKSSYVWLTLEGEYPPKTEPDLIFKVDFDSVEAIGSRLQNGDFEDCDSSGNPTQWKFANQRLDPGSAPAFAGSKFVTVSAKNGIGTAISVTAGIPVTINFRARAHGAHATSLPQATTSARAPTEGSLQKIHKTIDAAGGESLDTSAQGATPKNMFEALPEITVISGWDGFKRMEAGKTNASNYITPKFGLHFKFELKRAEICKSGVGLGEVSPAPELTMTSQTTAVALLGGTDFSYYEISAGLFDDVRNSFTPDGSVYAMGFVLTAVCPDTQMVATFYNRSGDVLSVQSATGALDQGNGQSPESAKGSEIFFGHMAISPTDLKTWVHRVRITARFGSSWGLDDFAYAVSP